MVQWMNLALLAVLTWKFCYGSEAITYEPIKIDSSNDDSKESLTFDPPHFSSVAIHSKIVVCMNISKKLSEYVAYYRQTGSNFYVGLVYNFKDRHLLSMIKVQPRQNVLYIKPDSIDMPSDSYFLLWPLQLDNNANTLNLTLQAEPSSINSFQLITSSVGYPSIEINIIEVMKERSIKMIHHQKYQLCVVRHMRTVDQGFHIVVTIIVTMNAFALGCISDVTMLKSQLKQSVIPLCVASGVQYIVLPLLTFSLVKAAHVLPELAVGLLICACIPGGGLGLLIVFVTSGANTDLSIAVNFLHTIVTMGTAPLWLYSLGQFLANGKGLVELPTHFIVLSLVVLLLPYFLGIAMKRCASSIADAILNWIVKPVLLLFFILFITLGLYINLYVLDVIDKLTLVVAGLIPLLGQCIGGGLALAARQGKPAAKTLAIESAIMSVLAVIAIVRFIMPQPDADLAVAGAFAIALLTPLPFLIFFIIHRVKLKITMYLEARKFSQHQQETIAQSFAVITQNALQISGMTSTHVLLKNSQHGISDNTLPTGNQSQESRRQSVVLLQSNSSIETIPLTQSNFRNYL